MNCIWVVEVKYQNSDKWVATDTSATDDSDAERVAEAKRREFPSYDFRVKKYISA